MAKELRIAVTIPVSDDLFQQAKVLAALEPAVVTLRASVAEHRGEFDCSVVTPRAAKSGE